MNQIKTVVLAVLALSILSTGCTSFQRNENFQIKVSAAPGTKFTCKYEFGKSSGAISTAVIGPAYQTVLDLPLAEGYFDITKDTPGTVLKAAVFEGKQERFSFRSSTNTPAFRLIWDGTAWKSEVIK
jgi:hypothetical protein